MLNRQIDVLIPKRELGDYVDESAHWHYSSARNYEDQEEGALFHVRYY